MISFFNKRKFSSRQIELITQTIAAAEKRTSGEIRVFFEPRCATGDPLHRAHIIFRELKMHETALRNGVLIYIAWQHKKFAICGDRAIHEIGGQVFWENVAAEMQKHFAQNRLTEGVIKAIDMAGNILQQYFPHTTGDKNELPDAPVISG